MDEDRDSNEWAHKRSAMVRDQIASRGVRDARVLGAMRSVPRERFCPEHVRASALEDRALPVEAGQTISQPYIVAYMTEHLDVRPEHRVLELGTGTGYQTAILAQLCRRLYTVERLEVLADQARRQLADLGVSNVEFHVGDGTLGWAQHAPYDRIMVTAGAPTMPKPLVEQLAAGGKMVLPVGPRDDQRLVRVERRAGRVVEVPLIAVRFVKLIGRAGWGPEET